MAEVRLTVKFFIYSQRAKPEAQDSLTSPCSGRINPCLRESMLSSKTWSTKILWNPLKSSKRPLTCCRSPASNTSQHLCDPEERGGEGTRRRVERRGGGKERETENKKRSRVHSEIRRKKKTRVGGKMNQGNKERKEGSGGGGTANWGYNETTWRQGETVRGSKGRKQKERNQGNEMNQGNKMRVMTGVVGYEVSHRYCQCYRCYKCYMCYEGYGCYKCCRCIFSFFPVCNSFILCRCLYFVSLLVNFFFLHTSEQRNYVSSLQLLRKYL